MCRNYAHCIIILNSYRKINYQGTTGLTLTNWYESISKSNDSNNCRQQAVKDPNFLKTIEDYTKKYNCEAAYFTEVNGNRTFVFVLDLPGPDMIPAIVEPLFQGFDAVEIHPTMNLDDLKKAISKI